MLRKQLIAGVTLLSSLFLGPSASAALGLVVLDDYSAGVRTGNVGDPLWAPYLGSGYDGQTSAVESGAWRVTTGAQGLYVHFFPYPYIFPDGFAQGWKQSGTWETEMNRLRFLMWCDVTAISQPTDGQSVLDIGTYVKHHGETTPNNQGQHYYHSFSPNFHAGRRIVFEMNNHPQHVVGGAVGVNYPVDPEWVDPTTGAPVHYMDGLTRFYIGDTSIVNGGESCFFDDFAFDRESGEPDDLVSSMTYQYTGARYEATWAGPRREIVNYDVRYASSSLRPGGFLSGTDGGRVTTTGNDYSQLFWASTPIAESPTGMFVAIRPEGRSEFTEVFVPLSSGAADTASPAAPSGLGVE